MDANRDEILTAAANGNAAALEFLRCFVRRAHYVDDLADQDKPPLPTFEAIGRTESDWLLTLTGNQFFLAHRATLVPAMLIALNAWVDSETVQWDSTDIRDVLKGQWHEVVWLVALLTGGWQKMREVSSKYRSFDLEEPKTQERFGRCEGCGMPIDAAIEEVRTRNGYPGFCSPGCKQQWELRGKEQNGAVRT